MQIIGNLFNIVLFVTAAGGAFTLLVLLANRVLGFALPLWFSVCGIFAYLIPFLAPGLYLIPPEKQVWVNGYYIACGVWIGGVVVFTATDVIKVVSARAAVRGYCVCMDERINDICARCVRLADLRKNPSVYFGTLDNPACVTGAVYPVVILKEDIVKQLTDTELMSVLAHEIIHIRRGHILLGRIFDYVCIVNWFNPLAWIAGKEFAVQCEVDCDRYVLKSFQGKITDIDYAGAMLRLLEVSMVQTREKRKGMSATGFLLTKRRMELILHRTEKTKKIIIRIILVVLLIVSILFSMWLSRGHFYPYPAYDTQPEYSLSEREIL